MSHIQVSEALIKEIADVADSDRRAVENRKEEQGVDDFLTTTIVRHVTDSPNLLSIDEQQINGIKQLLYDSVDIIITLIALSKTPDDIARYRKLAILTGRRHHHPLKFDEQTLQLKLKPVFGPLKTDRRKDVREKVRAAITLINESFAHKKTIIVIEQK
jgi:hypothetical protein